LRVTPAPDAAQLLDTLKRWTPDAALLQKILVSNPQALYE
jgi:predicted TIM-barrel fold metal-dependent hydrolase